MSLSRLLLPLSAAAGTFSLLSTSWLPSWLAGSSAFLSNGRRAHFLLTSIAAFSSALTIHLAVGLLSRSELGQAASLYDNAGQEDDDASSDTAKDGDKDKDATTSDDGKRWLKKEEVWDDNEADWVPRKVKEESTDELEAKKRTLFVVKHRTMPKQPGSKGHTVIEFTNSDHIVEVLRTIIKDSEELFEDQAKVDEKELFLAKQGIQEALEALKAQQERRKDQEDESKVAELEGNGTSTSDKVVPPSLDSTENRVEASASAQDTDRARTITSNTEALDEEDEDTDKPMAYAELLTRIDHVGVLLDFVNEHFASIQAKLDRLLPKGMISFKLLWCVIKPGTIVKVTHKPSGEAYAGMVKQCYYYSTISGEQFYMSAEYLDWSGDKYIRLDTSDNITSFAGLNKLSSLTFSPVTDTDRARLIERGRLFAKYSGSHYLHFTGALIQPGPRPCTFMKNRADGRVMIDKAGFRKMNPGQDVWDAQMDDYDDYSDDYNREQTKSATSQGTKAARDHVPSELPELSSDLHYLLTPPTVFGFSFFLKEWGEMLVESFEEIKFDTHAFEHLELDQDHKTLVRALVDATREDKKDALISDVVQGKGGGLIAVLHGNPGVGKTLTAEAVAEVLQRPLYIQGAGDLGIDAFNLERRLRDTLEIARVWGAVVLIDEADIFLEARSFHEVSRNSMVGVFLRTLEYQQGILFLTTNRVKSFDEAFLSRFSVAIRYPDLDQARRKKVWIKFLMLAGCDVEGQTPEHSIAPAEGEGNGTLTPVKAFIGKKDLHRFSQEQLNGRVIKQTVRTAQALAISANEPLQTSHIDQILRINKRFAEDFESAAPDYQVAGESWQNRTGLYH